MPSGLAEPRSRPAWGVTPAWPLLTQRDQI